MTAAMARADLSCRKGRQLIALGLLGLFLLVKLFAASEILHHVLHADSAAPEHQCVITLITQGHVAATGFPAGVTLIAAAVLVVLPWFRSAFVSSIDFRLASPRGPPPA